MSLDKSKFESSFLKEKIFVPLSLDTKLEPNRSKRGDTVFNWIIAFICFFMTTWFFTYNAFQDITGLSFVVTLVIYILFFSFTGYLFIVKYIYRIGDKIRERSKDGEGNSTISLSKIWNISAGGVTEEEFTKDIKGLVLKYHGCPALVYRTVNGSTDGLSLGSDQVHYAMLQKALDIVASKGYMRLKINLRYNTQNDPIWDYQSDRLYNVSSELGEDYVDMMNDVINYHYEYTNMFSKVSASYHIIKLDINSTVRDVMELYNALRSTVECRTIDLKLLSISEFHSLLQQYYGLTHIDINNVTSTTTVTQDIGKSKLLEVNTSTETNIKKQVSKVKILDNFYDNIYTEKFELPTEDIADIIKSYDIFTEDRI